MKTSKASHLNQRKLLDIKIQPHLGLRGDRVSPTGWLKAIRGALGITTRQLAAKLGLNHAAIIQFEKREAEGKVSLETIHKVARAMRCQLVYAIVPEEPFSSLESIMDDQAIQAARALIARVDHTMHLEKQGLSPEQSSEQVRELATRLKADVDPSLWGDKDSLLGKKLKRSK
jgi:predicted DNA-binding mobile mystery protein A